MRNLYRSDSAYLGRDTSGFLTLGTLRFVPRIAYSRAETALDAWRLYNSLLR